MLIFVGEEGIRVQAVEVGEGSKPEDEPVAAGTPIAVGLCHINWNYPPDWFP